MSTRLCCRCKIVKPLCDFPKNRTKRDGHGFACKECHQKECRRTRQCQNRRANYAELTRQKYRQTKDLVFAAYGGYQCAWCGCTQKKLLQIDHVHNDGAAHRASKEDNGKELYRWLMKKGFPGGFQVLCRNCNIRKYILFAACRNGDDCAPFPRPNTEEWRSAVRLVVEQMGGPEVLIEEINRLRKN